MLGPQPTHAALNTAAERAGLRTERGRPVRFVPPGPADPYYEMHLHETGQVHTRLGDRHDLFNALCWLAFPRTKARINAMHATEIPREAGRRGPLRDLLTILDEGGVLVAGAGPEFEALIRGYRWKALFWDARARVRASVRFIVLGHATLEQALAPRPGITCKAVFVDAGGDADAQAAAWLAALPAKASPRLMPPVPVFGYPGWLPQSEDAAFYDDLRWFRPSPTA
ncbi:MAG: DUF3025 domain-containing protein [Burkholderiales bacterium]